MRSRRPPPRNVLVLGLYPVIRTPSPEFSLQVRGRRSTHGHRWQAELAVIPGPGALGNNPYRDPLVEQLLHGWPHLLSVRSGVPLPDADTDREESVGVVDELGAPFDGNAAQRVVGVPVLDHEGDPVVAAQI